MRNLRQEESRNEMQNVFTFESVGQGLVEESGTANENLDSFIRHEESI